MAKFRDRGMEGLLPKFLLIAVFIAVAKFISHVAGYM